MRNLIYKTDEHKGREAKIKRGTRRGKNIRDFFLTLKNYPIYSFNNRAPKYMMQKSGRIEGRNKQFNNNHYRFQYSNFHNRTTRQMIWEEIENLNNIIDQMDLKGIHRKLHCKTTEYIFFSSSQGTFSRLNHMSHYNATLNKIQRIEII